ncbi:DUF4386 domain-containing protein [Phenylobacterium montanum]|uniref:DUF4386 domain-containing protein n=1 Tax=Phenylobacterium montanum TaxID=2823693 RepID=A0A975G3B7_9CAUL|nr:DUF4386 domain-containing protein [Caulobacter sp. S6]QUD90115.1 DUF4386 domain-containing protein [Caulobacter sp. S6]
MKRTTFPRLEARIAGLLYIAIIILGGWAEVGVRQGLVVIGDPAATARAIMAHESLFRLGFTAEMITNLIAIPVSLILYRLLAPTGRFLALIAVVFDLTQNTINAMNAWTQFAPITLLGGSPDLAAIPHAQLAAMARLALKWHDVGFSVALGFFGVALLIEGWLMIRSGYFPRWLGALYALAGGCYLANNFIFFLAPHLPVDPWIMLPSLIGEGAVSLWLLIVGVDEAKWRQAAVAG